MSYFQLPRWRFWRRKKAPMDLENLFTLPLRNGETAGKSAENGSEPVLYDSRQIFSAQENSYGLSEVSPVPEDNFMIPAAQQIKNADTADLNQSIGEKSSTAVLPENLPDETVYRDPVSLKKPTLQKGISLQENSAENTVRYERVSPVGYTAAGSGDEQNDTLSLPTLAEFSGGFPHNEPVSFHPGPAFQAEKNSTGEVTDFSSRNEPVSFHPGPISQAERNKVADSSGQDVFLRRESRPAEESGERYASSQLGVAVGALTDCARAQLRYLRKNYELLKSQSGENYFN